MREQIDHLKQEALSWVNQLVELKQSYTLAQLSAEASLLDKFITAKTEIARLRTEISNLTSPTWQTDLPGSYLISLLNSGLDIALAPASYLQDIYKIAEFWLERQPQAAQKFSRLGLLVCTSRLDLDTNRMLVANDKGNLDDIFDVDQLKTGRGKFYLLQAALVLNDSWVEADQPDQVWQDAIKLLEDSIDQFKVTGWFQLTALAYLGLAIINQRLSNIDEAERTCNQALRYALQESIVARIDTEQLKQAIRQQQRNIKALKAGLGEPSKTVLLNGSPDTDRDLPLFKSSQGQGYITGNLITRLNLLSRQDYEDITVAPPERVVLNSKRFDAARNADYILEIDALTAVEPGLANGDWLLVNTEISPLQLHGRVVAVLIRSDNQPQLGLRKFTKTGDHYFLEPLNSSQPGLVLAEYETEFGKVDNYYQTLNSSCEVKKAYEVQISGEIIEHISHEAKNEAAHSYVWRIPVVSDIAAGIGTIAREDIIDYLEIRDANRLNLSFGVQVVGNSMQQDGILDQQTALIRTSPSIDKGDIAAVVIFAPDLAEPLGVIKRYYVVKEQNEALRHWLLESSNPSSEHVVVVPAEADETKIRDMYEQRVKTGQINRPIFYQNGEVVIVGKFVRSA